MSSVFRTLCRRAGIAATVLTLTAGLIAAQLPPPAPRGIGDRLFPGLGNPGHDIQAYDIALNYSGDNTEPVRGVTVIDTSVTANRLSRLHLDFAQGTVRAVRVNGTPTRFTPISEELVIDLAEPAPRGTPLRLTIQHTNATRGKRPGGWVRTRDGLVTAAQADAAHRVFPSNDHPSDKAWFTFHITTPRRLTAVTSGSSLGTWRTGDTRTWSYRVGHPMAPEVVQIAIGDVAVVHRRGPRGLPLRDVVPVKHRRAVEPWLAKTPRQLAWMERRVGRYPFETYGVLAAEAPLGFALETQTLSLFSRRFFTDPAIAGWRKESVMVHELAHQWFGDSVSPRRWTDVWLNEGHATWYQWLYGAERGGPSLVERVRRAYRGFDTMRALYGPPAALTPPPRGARASIFRPVVYDGAAVVLYALRQTVGANAFHRLQRAWVAEHRDGVASTADFVRLAGQVSKRDLRGFLRRWLYGAKTPPMPGHPRWTVRPADRGAR